MAKGFILRANKFIVVDKSLKTELKSWQCDGMWRTLTDKIEFWIKRLITFPFSLLCGMYKAQYCDNSKVKTVSFHRILVLLHFNRQIMACRLDGIKPLSEPMLEYC